MVGVSKHPDECKRINISSLKKKGLGAMKILQNSHMNLKFLKTTEKIFQQVKIFGEEKKTGESNFIMTDESSLLLWNE